MLYRPTKIAANDREDMVEIAVGDLLPLLPYQSAFQVAHALRMACKSAARHDRVPADFWPSVDMEDLEDCPRPYGRFRRSCQVQNFTIWTVLHNDAEVALVFDGRAEVIGYEDGIKLHQMIRRAGRRAKAWAGDTSRSRTMLANLTNAEDDYRLGLSSSR